MPVAARNHLGVNNSEAIKTVFLVYHAVGLSWAIGGRQRHNHSDKSALSLLGPGVPADQGHARWRPDSFEANMKKLNQITEPGRVERLGSTEREDHVV